LFGTVARTMRITQSRDAEGSSARCDKILQSGTLYMLMDASKRGGEMPYISKQAAMVLSHYSAIQPHNLEGRTQQYSLVRY
jgi:hypothetical protein